MYGIKSKFLINKENLQLKLMYWVFLKGYNAITIS